MIYHRVTINCIYPVRDPHSINAHLLVLGPIYLYVAIRKSGGPPIVPALQNAGSIYDDFVDPGGLDDILNQKSSAFKSYTIYHHILYAHFMIIKRSKFSELTRKGKLHRYRFSFIMFSSRIRVGYHFAQVPTYRTDTLLLIL